jgi:Domain of unknown function (DUF397)
MIGFGPLRLPSANGWTRTRGSGPLRFSMRLPGQGEPADAQWRHHTSNRTSSAIDCDTACQAVYRTGRNVSGVARIVPGEEVGYRERSAHLTGQEPLVWRRSSRCEAGACIEMAHSGTQILVRDSKIPDSPRLVFGEMQWDSFVVAVRRGDFRSPQ